MKHQVLFSLKKKRKNYSRLSSAALSVIGALRVKSRKSRIKLLLLAQQLKSITHFFAFARNY